MYKTKGFSLIELSIVIAVMAILAGGAMAGKGFMDAAKITQAASAIETTRIAVEMVVARRGGRWHNPRQGHSVYYGDLVARNLVPEMPWSIGDIDISVVAVGNGEAGEMRDLNKFPIYIVAKGPLVQLQALFDRLESHHLFVNASDESSLYCTQEDTPYFIGPDVYAHRFCFQRSL